MVRCYSAKHHQHFWRARMKAYTVRATQSTLQTLSFVITILVWIHFFSMLCVILSRIFISSVWRKVLLLETQCFRFLPFSREAGSDNPIFYNAIPFKSSNDLDTQWKELFNLYSKTDNQHQNLRGRGAEGYPSPWNAGHSWEISSSFFCRLSIQFTICALENS